MLTARFVCAGGVGSRKFETPGVLLQLFSQLLQFEADLRIADQPGEARAMFSVFNEVGRCAGHALPPGQVLTETDF
jgi:hypothetical protein